MNAKYNLTVEENIFIAKRNIVDYIWKSARLEGLGVTFPQTDAIFKGLSAPNVKVEEVIAVNNLKRSWQFLFETIDCDTDLNYICHLNRVVGGDNLIYGAGNIRNIPVSIGGTSWKPEIPFEPDLRSKIKDIEQIASPTERAITLMLYCMRAQIFVDGNKRTSMLAANHIMIKHGCGIISIPIEYQTEFVELLVNFYETNEIDTIKQFVYDYCIDGLDLSSQNKAAPTDLFS